MAVGDRKRYWRTVDRWEAAVVAIEYPDGSVDLDVTDADQGEVLRKLSVFEKTGPRQNDPGDVFEARRPNDEPTPLPGR